MVKVWSIILQLEEVSIVEANSYLRLPRLSRSTDHVNAAVDSNCVYIIINMITRFQSED
jgi:hypothetical protein